MTKSQGMIKKAFSGSILKCLYRIFKNLYLWTWMCIENPKIYTQQKTFYCGLFLLKIFNWLMSFLFSVSRIFICDFKLSFSFITCVI